MTTPATQTLAECLVNACFENLPPDVVEKAKLCLMDSVGCFFGGHQTPVAPGLERLSADIAGGSANPPRPDPVRTPPGTHFSTRLWPTPLTSMTSTGRGILGRQWLLPLSRLPTGRAPQGAT